MIVPEVEPVIFMLPELTPAVPRCNKADGLVVPIPTFPVDLTNRYGDVAGAVPPMPTFPIEFRRILPLVAVLNVKSPEVFVQPDAPPDAKVNTPVELPMFVADVPVALMFAVPTEVRVVNVAAAELAPPIIVPSIVPPFISAVVTVPKSVHVAPAAVGEVVITGLTSVLLDKDSIPAKVASVPVVGNVILVVPV